MVDSLHNTYFDIQNKFSKGEINFDEYSQSIISWNHKFSNIIKAQTNNIQQQMLDNSKGGKLVKKKIVDKTGKTVTKWVRANEDAKQDKGKKTEINPLERRTQELAITIDQWKKSLPSASEAALQNASKYASNEEVRKLARHELLKRSFDLKKHLDMSLMPDFMLEDYVSRYDYVSDELTDDEHEAIHEYRDNAYMRINRKIRQGEKLDDEEKKIAKGVEKAIGKSELKNDLVLFRGLSAKNSLMFINYLKSLEPGDVYEEPSFSSTTLLQGASQKFSEMYNSTNNVTLKIYASKGQKALCLQNLGTEDDIDLYKDEFEFLLPRNQKFQIIENDGNEISVKLLD